jgi:hypothetical protein
LTTAQIGVFIQPGNFPVPALLGFGRDFLFGITGVDLCQPFLNLVEMIHFMGAQVILARN